jgi:hypothetical protein
MAAFFLAAWEKSVHFLSNYGKKCKQKAQMRYLICTLICTGRQNIS